MWHGATHQDAGGGDLLNTVTEVGQVWILLRVGQHRGGTRMGWAPLARADHEPLRRPGLPEGQQGPAMARRAQVALTEDRRFPNGGGALSTDRAEDRRVGGAARGRRRTLL